MAYNGDWLYELGFGFGYMPSEGFERDVVLCSNPTNGISVRVAFMEFDCIRETRFVCRVTIWSHIQSIVEVIGIKEVYSEATCHTGLAVAYRIGCRHLRAKRVAGNHRVVLASANAENQLIAYFL
jgi:hypothetical protein